MGTKEQLPTAGTARPGPRALFRPTSFGKSDTPLS
jgi:hypothetical protein